MFAWKISWRLFVGSFSAQPASLRYPGGKRVMAVVLVWLFLCLHMSFSWLCLWLDYLLYPGFRKRVVDRSLFIVGQPRSGTSFLLESLGEDTDTFTGFRLWELVFAPSIIQKTCCLWLGQHTGTLICRIVKKIESLFFRRMQGVHTLRFAALEEDEFLFMYLMRSIYLVYLFPELDAQHGLLKVEGKGRLAAMQFYKACVQRHLYVFDPEGKKVFLSKNPAYLTRLEALTTTFPEGRYIHLSRPLEEVAPSTLSLNRHLLSFFANVEGKRTPRIETLEILMEWQHNLDIYLSSSRKEKWVHVSFRSLTCHPSIELRKMYAFAGLEISKDVKEKWKNVDRSSKAYKSTHQYPDLTKEEITCVSSCITRGKRATLASA